jgi:serine protease inhibitor ecotin
MTLDVRHLDKTCEGKRLRVEFCDGETAEVEIIEVALPNKYDKTPESWGIVYNVISTNRPRKAPKGVAFWSELSKIKNFEILGDAN